MDLEYQERGHLKKLYYKIEYVLKGQIIFF
jgi:hypothetical protein